MKKEDILKLIKVSHARSIIENKTYRTYVAVFSYDHAVVGSEKECSSTDFEVAIKQEVYKNLKKMFDNAE